MATGRLGRENAPIASAAERIASDPLSAGWARLAEGEWGRCQGLFRRRFRRGGVTGGPGGVELGCVVPRRRDTLRVINGTLPPRANPPRLSYWSGAAPSVGADCSLVGGGTVSPSGDTSGS